MVPPAVTVCPTGNPEDETSPAPRHPASCPSQGDLPQGTATSFAFLRALRALVVLSQCYRGADPLGPGALGVVWRRRAACVVDAGRFASLGACDAPAGRASRAHHARTAAAAIAD